MPARNDEQFQPEGQWIGTRKRDKRRRRSAEEKHEIAEASLKPGASVRKVAEAYGVHPSQVGKWRRLYRSGSLRKAQPPALLAVRVTDNAQQNETSRASKSKANEPESFTSSSHERE